MRRLLNTAATSYGILAFNEVHPDYYQIPHADREALLREAEADDEDAESSSAVTASGDEEGEAGG